MGLDLEALQALPKVSLHDHLDGGLRPQTIMELAADIGHELPAEGADDLGRWFSEAADSGSLVPYLETFDQTIAVMQTAANLRRIAAEFVADLAADGVIYAEVRWAPEQHLKAGLTLAEAVEAVRDGLAEGMAGCRARGQEIEVRQLLTAMRQAEPTLDIAPAHVAVSQPGCRRVRSRWAGEWLPTVAVSGVLPAATTPRRLLHNSCRRNGRPGIHLRVGAGLRSQPDRARCRDH